MSSIKAAVYESELFGAAAPDVTLSRVAGNLVITPKNNAAPVKWDLSSVHFVEEHVEGAITVWGEAADTGDVGEVVLVAAPNTLSRFLESFECLKLSEEYAAPAAEAVASPPQPTAAPASSKSTRKRSDDPVGRDDAGPLDRQKKPRGGGAAAASASSAVINAGSDAGAASFMTSSRLLCAGAPEVRGRARRALGLAAAARAQLLAQSRLPRTVDSGH